jgi:hypothetical protein
VEGNNLHNKIAKGSWKLLLAGKGTSVCSRGSHRERERERERGGQGERKREKTHTDTTVQRFLVRIGKACFFYFLGFFLFSRK